MVSPTCSCSTLAATPSVGALITVYGGLGVSGDGVDQDDMVAFLGLQRASMALNGAVQEAPQNRRADTLTPQGTRLLYVQCPQAPFINSDQENVCAGF